MAYNTKYRTTFDDLKNNTYQIDLKLNNYIGSITEVDSGVTPISIELPSTNKFDAVKGFGATINLIASTDRQLIDLYTNNQKEWQVEIKKNGSIIFNGYVEPELYSEPFTVPKNYEVSVTCNNGLGILNREVYLDNSNQPYRGLTTTYDVIKNCINKIGISYDKINVLSDLKLNNITIPSDKNILQYITLNNDNYIDEDNISFNCDKVLRSVLEPLSLNIFIQDNQVYIIDVELLKSTNISFKSFNYSATTGSTVTINHNKNLSSTDKYNSSFQIEAGVNKYIVQKNRYVKDIIEKVDFDESYDGSDYSNVWQLKNNTITNTLEDDKGTDKRWWLNKLISFDNYQLNSTANTFDDITYFSTLPVSYAGAIKNQKIVDGQLINYDADEQDFNKYIFIQNPYRDWDNSRLDGTMFPYNHYEHNLTTILKTGFTYTPDTPFIYNSDNVKIRLNYTVKVISSGILTHRGSYGAPKWENVDEKLDEFGVFLYYTNIHFVDNSGNLKYFLRLKGSQNYNKDSQIPKYKDAVYELVQYTGQTFTNCLIYFNSINEAGNFVSIINNDFTSYIDIPVNFDKIYKLKVDFLNCFFTVTDFYYDGMERIEPDYYIIRDEFKESFPHIAFKDIYTEIVNDNGDAMELNDEEIQYYLSDSFQTSTQTTELLNYTADNKYITDVAGVSALDLSGNVVYITDADSNSIFKTNLEDLKGQKYINQYQNNRIILRSTIDTDSIYLYNSFSLDSDSLWYTKKWIPSAFNFNLKLNELNITLDEIF